MFSNLLSPHVHSYIDFEADFPVYSLLDWAHTLFSYTPKLAIRSSEQHIFESPIPWASNMLLSSDSMTFFSNHFEIRSLSVYSLVKRLSCHQKGHIINTVIRENCQHRPSHSPLDSTYKLRCFAELVKRRPFPEGISRMKSILSSWSPQTCHFTESMTIYFPIEPLGSSLTIRSVSTGLEIKSINLPCYNDKTKER